MDFKFPCHWSYQEAQDFCLKIADGTHDSPKETTFGKQLVTSKNIIGGYLNLSNTYLISEKDYDQINKRSKVDKFDILLSMIGTVGQICLVEQEPNFAIKNVGLLKNADELKARYLYYYLSSIPAQNAIKKRLRGTTQQYLTLGEIRKFPIHYPPEKEMGQIVTILNKLDKKITLNNQINETLEAMAQAIFKSWFIDFEPVKAKIEARDAGQDAEGILLAAMSAISGKEIEALKTLQNTAPEEYAELKAIAEQFPDSLEESELGLIPKGWGVSSLGELIEITKGKSYRSNELQESTTALVSLKSIQRGGGYQYGGLKEYIGKYKPEQEVFAGDLIVACTDVTQNAEVIGKSALIPTEDKYEHLVISLDLCVLRPHDINYLYYLYGITQTATFEYHMKAHSTGTTVLHLDKNAIPTFEIALPSNNLILLFNNHMKDIFKLINNNQLNNKTLTELRDTLLPKLLSGEIDVSNVEIDELLENED